MNINGFQRRLLDEWQRSLPLISRPFHVMAQSLGSTAEDVLQQLADFIADGTVSRVGPVFRPNTVGVSSLVAVAVPANELEAAAALINTYKEVNHNYERENVFNLWFVVTAHSLKRLHFVLDNMEVQLQRPLLRLPLVKDYHIDLGFPMFAAQEQSRSQDSSPLPRVLQGCDQVIDQTKRCTCHAASMEMPDSATDNISPPHQASTFTAVNPQPQSEFQAALVAQIQSGLALKAEPYRVVADALACTEQTVMDALGEMQDTGVIKRLGVIVRHHELGYRANAMVVWNVADELVDSLGYDLGAESDVTLCYQRPRVPGRWPYNLFCMIHGKDRATVEAKVQVLRHAHGLQHIDSQILFSGRRFKQRGAVYRSTTKVVTCSRSADKHRGVAHV